MSKKSYQQLIAATCKKYIDEMQTVSDIKFDLDQSVLDQIYDNAVFPTQGTRP
jgi:cell division protease FtsH